MSNSGFHQLPPCTEFKSSRFLPIGRTHAAGPSAAAAADDSDESEDEMEELRRAARAVREAAAEALKRRREQPPEVVVISDSDDDVPPAAKKRSNSMPNNTDAAAAVPHAAAAARGTMSLVLPSAPRPSVLIGGGGLSGRIPAAASAQGTDSSQLVSGGAPGTGVSTALPVPAPKMTSGIKILLKMPQAAQGATARQVPTAPPAVPHHSYLILPAGSQATGMSNGGLQLASPQQSSMNPLMLGAQTLPPAIPLSGLRDAAGSSGQGDAAQRFHDAARVVREKALAQAAVGQQVSQMAAHATLMASSVGEPPAAAATAVALTSISQQPVQASSGGMGRSGGGGALMTGRSGGGEASVTGTVSPSGQSTGGGSLQPPSLIPTCVHQAGVAPPAVSQLLHLHQGAATGTGGLAATAINHSLPAPHHAGLVPSATSVALAAAVAPTTITAPGSRPTPSTTVPGSRPTPPNGANARAAVDIIEILSDDDDFI